MQKASESPQYHLTQRILIVIILIVLLAAVGLLLKKQPVNTSVNTNTSLPLLPGQPTAEPVVSTEPSTMEISPEEKAAIDIWIEKNDLNFYGDPKDSMYAGGTPLFDESTGTYTDRYEYIVNNHPDRPWQQ